MNNKASESVILLHGLARSYRCMLPLTKALQELGYHTVNCDYPSTRFPIETLADSLVPQALAKCHTSSQVHFVTHSMGGIIVRYYLQRNSIPQFGRMVMLGPPNKGSELADKFKVYRWYRWLLGPAAMQLGTGSSSFVNRLHSINSGIGIIAGKRAFNWLGARALPKPSDGMVSVESTRLEGMEEHIVLPVSHPFMMNDKQVIAQTLNFLQHGCFLS